MIKHKFTNMYKHTYPLIVIPNYIVTHSILFYNIDDCIVCISYTAHFTIDLCHQHKIKSDISL